MAEPAPVTGREYGPVKLGPLDMVVGLAAVRLVIGSGRVRAIIWALLAVCAAGAVLGAVQGDALLLALGLLIPVLLLVLLPMIRAAQFPAFTLEFTSRGLIGKSATAETLYLGVQPARMRTVLGRLLIPLSGNLVIIVPLRQIGEEAAAQLRRDVLALDFS